MPSSTPDASFKHDQKLSFIYVLLSIVVLSFYGTRVCPFIDTLPAVTIIEVFFGAFAAGLIIKAFIEPHFVNNAPAVKRPVRQLFLDMALYLIAGSVITWVDVSIFDFPVESGFKVIIGCLTFGVFASLDNALLRERENLLHTNLYQYDGKVSPITKRIFIAFTVVVGLTGTVLALVVLKDVNYIIENVLNSNHDTIKRAVFIDILFVIGIVLLLSFRLMTSYSKNIDILFSMQIKVLDKVRTGELNTRVPIATRDEFSLIADKTNTMIQSLSQAREEEKQLVDMTLAISSEIHLKPLLFKIIDTTKIFLNADRCTLFLHDKSTNELWSMVAQGMDSTEIRIPDTYGIAGHVFHHGGTLNITDAYNDKRFNQDVDKDSGYTTQTILCMPVIDKEGNCIGVIQALNKVGGVFNSDDEERLKTFSAQAAIALVNAQLFQDVNNMRIYNENVLKSLSNGVITLDEHAVIAKANQAALATFNLSSDIIGMPADKIFTGNNEWILDNIVKVHAQGDDITSIDADYTLPDESIASINLNSVPLCDLNDNNIGSMLIIDDISNEKRVRNTMSRYFTEEVAEQLLVDGASALGGTSQEVSVLFSDIRGFTSLSESIGPRETVSMLNDYFSVMVDEITLQHGILDKFIGDAMMAIFGAPFSSENDADNSVKSAISMMTKLSDFNTQRANQGHAAIDIGIGISSGEVILGNIGSDKRMDYTVIGDTVNLASRLEGTNKHYGTRVLISETTKQLLKGSYTLREIDRLRVKGKNEPAIIFEILDHYNDTTFPNRDETLTHFFTGTKAYQEQDWFAALNAFNLAKQCNNNDGPTAMYIKRCQHFLSFPPTEDWDGVWTMTEK